MATLLRPVRGRLIVVIVVQAIASALMLSPLVTGAIIAERLIADARDPGIWPVLVTGLVLLGLGLVLKASADLIAHLADNDLTLILRRRLAARLRGAPLGWFTDTSAGRVKQGMQDDVTALHHLVAHSYAELAGAVATPIAAYAYLFVVDWRLALVLLVPLPVFIVIYGRMLAGMGKDMAEYGRVLEDVNSAVVEFVDGIPVVKTFGQTGRASAAYRSASDRFTRFFIGWARPMIAPETIANLAVAPAALLLLTLVFGSWFVSLGWMQPVQVIPFALVGLGIGGPISVLTSNVMALQMANGAAARLHDLLDTEQLPEPPAPSLPDGSRIEFDRVSFGYDTTRMVLRDVSVAFEPGTVTAIVGASGSGKTTLARLVLRYADPAAGRVLLGGVPLPDVASDELFRTVGAVFQNVRLLRMSVAENIALARPDASLADLEQVAKTARIHDRILELPRGYDSVIGDDARLSGGEAQRVSIARALLLDPEVLVLDEATSAADAANARAIQAGLSALVSQRSRTIIVIAHRLDSVKAADRILVLDDGRIVEDGTHRDLIERRGTYHRLWHAQHPADRAQPPAIQNATKGHPR
ncbi:ABC transporter ATP-binding protein [Micromonospora craniellae]|uniref:ABC transporter ATP-binding protein n=2 Tax=Micromonospora craniellae TaxID=2294034 RepID=A0A372FZW6_9ACTN|nr:ABC transporter ATP-binding protein [Micromonospora craniellae]RFS46325.1 ABC transporter ATP-binding protein [Micromonospora craniellae]